MTNTQKFQKHFAALSAVFVLGDSVISMPYSTANDMTLPAFLISSALVLLLYLIILPVVKGLFKAGITPDSNTFLKSGAFILFFFISLYSLWTAASSFEHFVRFVKSNLLPETPMFFIALIFAVSVFVLAGKRQGVLLKFSLLAGVAITVTILLFFFLSSDEFDFHNVMVFNIPDFNNISRQCIPYLKEMVLPALLLPVYQAVIFKESNKKSSYLGLAAGIILLGLCLLNSILIFGSEFAAKLDFPYAAAISTVTIGQLFTRMDGFSYFIYFAGSLIKITVCIDIIKGLLLRTNKIFRSPEKQKDTVKATAD